MKQQQLLTKASIPYSITELYHQQRENLCLQMPYYLDERCIGTNYCNYKTHEYYTP